MAKNLLLKAAIRRGFLKEAKDGSDSEFQLGSLGLEVKRNLITDWIRNVQGNRICVNFKSDIFDEQSRLHEAMKSQLDRRRIPFCIAFQNRLGHENGLPIFGSQSTLRDTEEEFTQCNFYLICHPRRMRLNFAEILRRRQNWWTEIVNHDSKFRFTPSSTDSIDRASHMLPYSMGESQPNGSAMVNAIEIIEEIPKLDFASDISTIRNTIRVEPAVLAILEDGASKIENEDAIFRLHKRITPHPIAILCDSTNGLDADAVEALCSHMRRIMDNLGIRFMYEKLADENLDMDARWKRLKESGVLYAFVINADVIRTGVIKFLHHDLDMEIETALPNIRSELVQRLGCGSKLK